MSGFTSFAVAGGTGGLGAFVVKALLATKGASVAVLSRKEVSIQGATVKVVDYSSSESLVSALAGVDVVISTLGSAALPLQHALGDAAKQARVSLFVPSEFGVPTDKITEGPLLGKAKAAAYLKEIGLPSLRVFTGPFPELVLGPHVGFDWENGKVQWVGKGDTPITFTTRADIATFLAHALTTLPRSKLDNSLLSIEGDRKTLNQAVEIYERTHPGKKITVTRTSVDDAQKIIDEDKTAFLVYLKLKLEQGATSESNDNALLPEWHPTTLETLLAAL